MSFALLAKEIKRWGICVAFDFRGHGYSKVEKNVEDLSLNTLIQDSLQVFEYLDKMFNEPSFIIVGHR